MLGDLSLDYAPWSGKPVEVDRNQIKTLTENNQHHTTREIADILKCPNQMLKIICTSLVMLIALMFGFHISEKNLLDHISACDSLLKRKENVLFLKQIVTGGEKDTLQ